MQYAAATRRWSGANSLRLASQRYRKAHAQDLRTARQIAQILPRGTEYAGDLKRLTSLIRSLGCDDFACRLGRELRRRGRFGLNWAESAEFPKAK